MNGGRGAAPAVSIVLPTHQRAALLGRAIDSVLAQTFEDFELLVVDDGSTDATPAVLAAYTDPRLRVLRHDTNRGAAAARNRGIGAARAAVLAFQDSDDEWVPDKLERQMGLLATCPPTVAVVYSDMERVHRDGRITYFRSPAVQPGRLLDDASGFYQVCGLGIQATLIRRACFEAVGGFDERFPALEDLELFIRLSRRYEFRHLAVPLVRYHETEGLSANLRAKVIARRLLLELYGTDLAHADAAFLDREQAALAAAARRLEAAAAP